jgi:glucosamine--fructose-6-phosphate aminotransferase (isomerizing)
MTSNATYQEILTQVDAWKDAATTLKQSAATVESLWRDQTYDYVVFTGCGSTYYLAQTAARLTRQATGIWTQAVPASELLLYPADIYMEGKKPLLVAISRSAATTETIQAVERFNAKFDSATVVISCYADKPLNALASLNLSVLSGQEQSIVQTRSFSAMLVLAEGFARLIGGEGLPDGWFDADSQAFVEKAREIATPFANPDQFDRYFFLGGGTQYGLAQEATLKMKEVSLSHAEAFHPMEFRHGPMSLVDERAVVVGILGDADYESGKAVLGEMRELGATTLLISDQPDADYSLIDHATRPALARNMPALQWMAYERAINKQLDPDHPRNLAQVIVLKDEIG